MEAEEYQAGKAQELSDGNPRDKVEKVTLQDFSEDWLRLRRSELRAGSVEHYANTIRRLTEYFAKDTLLRSITVKDAVTFVSSQKCKASGRVGQELSDWGRELIKRTCRTIFESAVDWGYIRNNPFRVKMLKSKKLVPKRWHRVTVQEYHRLLEVAPTLRWKVFYALAYTSGARTGELFSLTWNDVDFEKGMLLIASREGTVNIPPFMVKDHEARRIPLPKHTVDLLAEYHAEAPEGVPYVLLDKDRYERVKARWQSLRKKRLSWRNRYMVNNVLRDFNAHCRRAGIKPVGKLTVHTLRKSCGQNWADHLPMNVVKELMGHSSASTTLRFYNQVDGDHLKKAARVIKELVGGRTRCSV